MPVTLRTCCYHWCWSCLIILLSTQHSLGFGVCLVLHFKGTRSDQSMYFVEIKQLLVSPGWNVCRLILFEAKSCLQNPPHLIPGSASNSTAVKVMQSYWACTHSTGTADAPGKSFMAQEKLQTTVGRSTSNQREIICFRQTNQRWNVWLQ